MLIEYRSCNSGGKWWLTDEDWPALEKAGWKVEWIKDKAKEYAASDNEETKLMANIYEGLDRWLGSLATEASKEFETPAHAMREFESITGKQVSEEGCNCCGAPHSFRWPKGYAEGEECLQHLFDNVPRNLREATEALNKK